MSKGVRPAASCIVNVIYPWSQLSLNDGVFSGQPGFPVRQVFQEAVDYLPGLAGESRDFDANGPYIRVLLQGGTLTYSLSPGLFGSALAPIDSVQPTLPASGKEPPLQPNVACETQAPITSLYAAPGAPIKAMRTSLSAPGAALRWTSAALATIQQFTADDAEEGIKTTISDALASVLKSNLVTELSGIKSSVVSQIVKELKLS